MSNSIDSMTTKLSVKGEGKAFVETFPCWETKKSVEITKDGEVEYTIEDCMRQARDVLEAIKELTTEIDIEFFDVPMKLIGRAKVADVSCHVNTYQRDEYFTVEITSWWMSEEEHYDRVDKVTKEINNSGIFEVESGDCEITITRRC